MRRVRVRGTSCWGAVVVVVVVRTKFAPTFIAFCFANIIAIMLPAGGPDDDDDDDTLGEEESLVLTFLSFVPF